jgi:hypothetical protein
VPTLKSRSAQIHGETFLTAYNELKLRDGHSRRYALQDFRSEDTRREFRNASPLKIYKLEGTVHERTNLALTAGFTAEGVWVAFTTWVAGYEAALRGV